MNERKGERREREELKRVSDCSMNIKTQNLNTCLKNRLVGLNEAIFKKQIVTSLKRSASF